MGACLYTYVKYKEGMRQMAKVNVDGISVQKKVNIGLYVSPSCDLLPRTINGATLGSPNSKMTNFDVERSLRFWSSSPRRERGTPMEAIDEERIPGGGAVRFTVESDDDDDDNAELPSS